MAKRVTIKDIAKALDTNTSTVSRALNDSPLISDQTKALVKQKAVEMGYRPNSIARQLRKGKSKTIGLVVPFINREFFANIIHGVESIAKQKGYQLLICQSNDSRAEEAEAVRILYEQKVSGILVSIGAIQSDTEEGIFQEIVKDGTPLVMFDRASATLNVNRVVNANREGSYQATKHLIEQGYRRIAYFGGPTHLNMYLERYVGYCQALAEANIPLDSELIYHPVLEKQAGASTMQEMLDSGVEFDALAAASDLSGLGALLTMQAAGIKLPEDKGLVGFANESFTELLGMSSVELYSIEMGKAAVRLLFEEIEQNSQVTTTEIRRQVEIVPKLIPRATSMRREE